MTFFYDKITYLFDPLHHLWEQEKIHRKIYFALVLFFLCSVISIELNFPEPSHINEQEKARSILRNAICYR